MKVDKYDDVFKMTVDELPTNQVTNYFLLYKVEFVSLSVT
jgi:hypothetical protein